MRQCQYDGIESHIESHRSFTNTIPQLKKKLLSSQSKQVAEETYLFLFDWLTHHIVGEDMKFSQQASARFDSGCRTSQSKSAEQALTCH